MAKTLLKTDYMMIKDSNDVELTSEYSSRKQNENKKSTKPTKNENKKKQ